MSLTKLSITKQLNQLKYISVRVYHFNSHKRMPFGSVGWCDHVLMSRRKIVFIEDKIGRDILSDKQVQFKDAVETLAYHSPAIHYFNVKTQEDIDNIINFMSK